MSPARRARRRAPQARQPDARPRGDLPHEHDRLPRQRVARSPATVRACFGSIPASRSSRSCRWRSASARTPRSSSSSTRCACGRCRSTTRSSWWRSASPTRPVDAPASSRGRRPNADQPAVGADSRPRSRRSRARSRGAAPPFNLTDRRRSALRAGPLGERRLLQHARRARRWPAGSSRRPTIAAAAPRRRR